MVKNEVTVLDYLQKLDERVRNFENLLSIQKNVLNLDEVCSLTGLSKSHLYKLTCWQKIPFYKQAKHLYFDRQEIETWLKSIKVKTISEIDREASTYVTTKGGRA